MPPELRAHGGIDTAELRELGLGVQPQDLLDLSVNLNPYGPSRTVERAAREARLDLYPEPTGSSVRELLGAELGCDPERLVLGHGAAELMWLCARTWLEPGQPALSIEPTFSEFRAAARAQGAEVIAHRARAQHGFALDYDSFGATLRLRQPRVVYLCAPNNPTGSALPITHIYALAGSFANALFIVDQAFLSLSERHHDARLMPPDNVLLLRSLTKDHALAGIRVGYLIASAQRARELEAARPPWSTSSPALAAIAAACRERGFIARSRERLMADRAYLEAGLRRLGLSPLTSSTIYTAVDVGQAAALRRRLLVLRQIVVRDCTSFGMPRHVRIAARPPEVIDRLLDALQEEPLE